MNNRNSRLPFSVIVCLLGLSIVAGAWLFSRVKPSVFVWRTFKIRPAWDAHTNREANQHIHRSYCLSVGAGKVMWNWSYESAQSSAVIPGNTADYPVEFKWVRGPSNPPAKAPATQSRSGFMGFLYRSNGTPANHQTFIMFPLWSLAALLGIAPARYFYRRWTPRRPHDQIEDGEDEHSYREAA